MGSLKYADVGELREVIAYCKEGRESALSEADKIMTDALASFDAAKAKSDALRIKARNLAEKERWARVYLAQKQEPYMLKEPSPLVTVDMADLEARVLAMEAENGDLKARLAAHGLMPTVTDRPMTDVEIREHLIANWRNEWWGLMDCDRCPNGRGPNGSPCKQCPRWKGMVNEHRARLERKAA